MSYCLCCNASLLQHVRQGALYWYCPRCRQPMPEAATHISVGREDLAAIAVTVPAGHLVQPTAL